MSSLVVDNLKSISSRKIRTTLSVTTLSFHKKTRLCRYEKVYVERMENQWTSLAFKARATQVLNKLPGEIAFVDLCFFVPCFHVFFDLMKSLGQQGLRILRLKSGPNFQNGLNKGKLSYTQQNRLII